MNLGTNLYANVLVPVVAASLMNAVIFTKKWNNYRGKSIKFYSPYLPSGSVIAVIWTILFALVGYMHYLLMKQHDGRPSVASIAIVLLILFCIMYPILTNGLRQRWVGLLNLLTLIFSGIVGFLVYRENPCASVYTLPLLAWATYVNLVYTL
jgi:tryptophan-rich sensory protein